MERVTKEILYAVGITPRYKGHWYIEYSMHILKHDEELLYKIAASLYSKVAAHYDVSIYSVEYDIRTAIIVAWKTNRNWWISKNRCHIRRDNLILYSVIKF